MSHTSPSTSTRPSTLRRWATRATVAAAGVGLVAGLAAPAASAAPITEIHNDYGVQCIVNRDVSAGPAYAGYTTGNCDTRPGKFYPGLYRTAGVYSIGQVYLPGGASYSAWVEKVW
jgi:hypothetical protein